MKVIYKENENSIHIKSWCIELPQNAEMQAVNLSKLPFAFHHVALMPDSHQGFGCPIGTVFAAKDTLVPNIVGVDIGCGMAVMRLNIKKDQLDYHTITEIVKDIRAEIPMGREHRKSSLLEHLMIPKDKLLKDGVMIRQYDIITNQIGTLGGSNHFIEFQVDDKNNVWVMLHSGSRNIGKQVADFYNNQAKELNRKWHSKVPKEFDLAFLPIGEKTTSNYITEMNKCVQFAKINRTAMMTDIFRIVSDYFVDLEKVFELDVAHNYARLENHYGKNVWVHRKGATSARKDEIGIIPGSCGTASYIVTGAGNEMSFSSCSHGAGRKMGRREAIRTLKLEDELKTLNSMGVYHSIDGVNDLDEASSAYKNINTVMFEQRDLVSELTKLTPIVSIKEKKEEVLINEDN